MSEGTETTEDLAIEHRLIFKVSNINTALTAASDYTKITELKSYIIINRSPHIYEFIY